MEDARADWQHLRDQLVDGLQQAGHVSSDRVTAAIRAVPRHVFVPGIEAERAYQNEAFPIKYDEDGFPVSSSSQPAIMARMLDQLDVQPGQRVLEIGTGSGYNAALLGHLVGETGTVVSVDIDADLVTDARERLAAYGVSQVTVVCGDGGLGWSEHARPLERYHFLGAPTESSLSEEDYRDGNNAAPRIDREPREANVDADRFSYPVPPLTRFISNQGRQTEQPRARALEFFDAPQSGTS